MTLDQLKSYRHDHRSVSELMAEVSETERFVRSIPDEYMRKMISARYIKGLTWREISTTFYPNSEDNCRKMVQRYLHQIGVE